MAHYQQNPVSVNCLAVSMEQQAVAPALNETVGDFRVPYHWTSAHYTATAVKTVEVPAAADMQTEALVVDELTTQVRIQAPILLEYLPCFGVCRRVCRD